MSAVIGATYQEFCDWCASRGLRPALSMNHGFDTDQLAWLSVRRGRNVLVAVPLGSQSLDEAAWKALLALTELEHDGEL